MAKAKATNTETETEAPKVAAPKAETLWVDAVPEIRFRLKADAGADVTFAMGSQPLAYRQGINYGCSRAQWQALAATQLFELIED